MEKFTQHLNQTGIPYAILDYGEDIKIIEPDNDTTFFTTLLFKNGTVTRELQVTLTNNVYQGNIRQYDFKKADSIGVYSLSINGRILDLGYFSKQKYVFIGKPSIKNRLMMSMEDTDGDGVIDGGNIDGPTITAPSPSPSNPFPFPIIPPTYPTNPSIPPPPPPSFPPVGGGGGSGGSFVNPDVINNFVLDKAT